jgi:hypothetical protein
VAARIGCALAANGRALPATERVRSSSIVDDCSLRRGGYALSNLFTKDLSNLIGSHSILPLALVAGGAATCAVVGFASELGALRRREASGAVPIYRGLQILIPILCAPVLFGERWPSNFAALGLLLCGLVLTLVGIVCVSFQPTQASEAPSLIATVLPEAQRPSGF